MQMIYWFSEYTLDGTYQANIKIDNNIYEISKILDSDDEDSEGTCYVRFKQSETSQIPPQNGENQEIAVKKIQPLFSGSNDSQRKFGINRAVTNITEINRTEKKGKGIHLFKDREIYKHFPMEALNEKVIWQLLTKFFSNQNSIDLLFAFASPFSKPGNPDVYLGPISYRSEFEVIDETLTKLKRNIKYSKVWATSANLAQEFTKNPQILHFSGHGISIGEEEVKGKRKKSKEEDYLVIENNRFEGEKLTVSQVKDLVNKEKMNVQVAVVMSCHSQNIGEIFRKTGIEHVICVTRKEEIDDKA